MNLEQARPRRQRRFRIMLGIVAGVGIGVGVGAFAVLAGNWLYLSVTLIPLAVRVARIGSGRTPRNSVDWLYPVIAPVAAIVTAALLPTDLAVPAVALGIVTWFLVVVVGASIDYLLEPALTERPRP